MKKRVYLLLAVVVSITFWLGGGAFRDAERRTLIDSLQIRKKYAESPVLTPAESMKTIELEPGFELRLVVSEPLINSPVAMIFDTKGRIWVAEMDGYMPDTVGTGEEVPRGRIVILSDSNNDGVMDSRKVLIDSLLLPRALCLVEGGLLLAEPPKLWYYSLRDDKVTGRQLVDEAYAEGGNVEHQPNGLIRAMDNWIYNAKSDKRYRKQGAKWLIEKTHFRGQWGISQDDQGRLYYNTNSENLLADYFLPGFGAGNTNQRGLSGFNTRVVANNRVYPARATTGVNRGYQPGVLDDSLRLVNFTAACGPLVYQGGLLGSAYQGNVFVAEPSANLIKRNIIAGNGYHIQGKQAYSEREFLRSTDERFRPVNLFDGPDGALYIIDMYRGIIQHKTYLTPYLKNEIKERSLTDPLTCGRIYKVVPKAAKPRLATFNNDPATTVRLLSHTNGWVRNTAQQVIVDSKNKAYVPLLRKFIVGASHPAKSHALWALEGLNGLAPNDVLPLLMITSFPSKAQLFGLSQSLINAGNFRLFHEKFLTIAKSTDSVSAPYVAFLAGNIARYDNKSAELLLMEVATRYGKNAVVSDAVISNLKDQEAEFLRSFSAKNPDTSFTFNKRLRKVIDDVRKAKESKPDLAQQYPRGAAIFKTFCQTCHGADGNGVTALAPPLNNSEWVTGSKTRLAAIVLYGLTGPVKIGNKVYQSPEINGEMPGIAANPSFSDTDIAELLSYIRGSWNNKADKVDTKEVSDTRSRYQGRQKPFTTSELN